MQMPLHDHLRRQIVKRAAVGLPLVFINRKIRPPKISQLHFLILADQYILRFDISMNNILFMDILDRSCHLVDILRSLQLVEFFIGTLHQRLEELSFLCELEDEVYREIILEVGVKIDDIGVL